MSRENKLIYLLNPVIFIAMGLLLLIGVIVFHDHINSSRMINGLAAQASPTAGQSTPKEVLGEIARNSQNIPERSLEFMRAGRSIKYLYQMSPNFFITQE